MPLASSSAFEPGPGIAIVAPRCLVLAAHGDDVHADALVAAAQAPEPLDALLSSLTSAGVRRAPSFVLVLAGDATSTVLVRGQGAVTAELADGSSVTVDAAGVSTWVEHQVPAAVSFSAWLTDARPAPSSWRVDAGVLPATAVHGWRPRTAVAPPSPVVRAADDDFDFGHLLEHTVFFGTEAAAMRTARSAEPNLAAPRAATPPPPLGGDPNATLLPFTDGPLEPAPGAGPVVPTAPAAHPAPVVAPPPSPVSPHVPSVPAVRCPAGHANAPEASHCRSCGARIEVRSTVVVPRPTLGRLRFDTGQVVELTRPLLIGRKPPVGETVNGEPAAAIALPDPDHMLSRLHLEVRLDGWRVLVIDRRSVNTTQVHEPGKPSRQLRADEPHPIMPGTVVNLGDHASFTYELDRP